MGCRPRSPLFGIRRSALHHRGAPPSRRRAVGTDRVGDPTRPDERLVLYEFEACPFCHLVRDALGALDLEVLIRPCPKRGQRFRPWVREQGREQLPYLVDPNTGMALYESRAIIDYLFRTYGDPKASNSAGARWALLRNVFIAWTRFGAGTFVRASRPAERPLELWGGLGGRGSQRVRERLCVLETPHIQHWESRELRLCDPNTGGEVRGASAILTHLERHYGRPTC